MTSATILIPDVSGFTKFLSEADITHCSHMLTELLESIIQSNKLGFHVSEVEGDAVLFYKRGCALPRKMLIGQCVEMYCRFHQQLKMLEKNPQCKCGTYVKASHLTLKFIVHYGEIQEISVSNFLKATGTDMVVAHRLLKNGIQRHEYLLLSKSYLDECGNGKEGDDASASFITAHLSRLIAECLEWQSGWEEYSSIGKVEYEYACLEPLRWLLKFDTA
jgi:hypothetical protein